MGFYQFKRQQQLAAKVDEVWEFISSPENLGKITPKSMDFKISSRNLSAQMYPGMIISYRLKPALGIRTTWVTEITQVRDKVYFVDEQRIGPYAMWHHEHFIEAIEKGVLMTDVVSYKPPLGFLGSLANRLFIKRKLTQIFEYRKEAMIERFGKYEG